MSCRGPAETGRPAARQPARQAQVRKDGTLAQTRWDLRPGVTGALPARPVDTAAPAAAARASGAAPQRLRAAGTTLARALVSAAGYAAPGTAAAAAGYAARRVPDRVRARQAAVPGAEASVLPGPGPGRPGGATWACGAGPVVYLLEGYHGKGHMGCLVPPLVQAGYRAVTVTVPAHCPGGPRRYQRGIVPEYVSALEAAAGRHGDPFAVIGHSLGGYAAQLAVLRGPLSAVACLVLIESPPDAPAIARELARRAGLGRRAAARLPRALVRQAGLTEADADAAARAREDTAPRRVLVAYDDSSACVPPQASLSLAGAWGAERFTTSGRGHTRILTDPGLHARVVEHLAGSATR
jgi:pimeloyl-ACP methyl ester carboxylesterase